MNGADAASAEALFAALGRRVRDGGLALGFDYTRLAHIDSPVSSEADGNVWAYSLLALTALIWWLAGWPIALGVAVAGVAAYLTLGRAYIHRRIRRRVEDKALADLALWRQLWSHGGVSLTPKAGEACAAPRGNWMGLVRGLDDAR